MAIKYIVIIQCEIAHKRCSGFACTNAFYNREGQFQPYEDSTRYISFTCGGCCGKGIASKLEHFSKHLKNKNAIGKDEVVVHLASCITTENYHYDRCPHADYLKSIIVKKGFQHIIEGSYISKGAEGKRTAGIYKQYE